jgi:2-furoyl-CoA dehydrogenase large subunit
VVAQIVADALGLKPADVRVVTDIDTTKDAWSIASGNYSSRFAAATGGAVHLAAMRLRERLTKSAAAQLNVNVKDIEFVDGRVRARGNPDDAQALRETVFWTPPELTPPSEGDEINSSLCYGYIFDFCGVEVDRVTGAVKVDKYVTMHDCGRVLHPGMVAGQVTGGFAHALGAALYEEYAYGPDGSFLAGTFADYLVPTTMEVPAPLILHFETPSPFTLLGAKGVGEGNCMSTPVCVANAVADALGLDAIDLPLAPAKLAAFIHPKEGARPASVAAAPKGGRALHGEGTAKIAAPPERVWAMLLDIDTLAAIIPGAHGVAKVSDTHFRADVTLGIGPVKGRYKAEVKLSDLDPPKAVTLAGSATGALGFGRGEGRVTLAPAGEGTKLSYSYEAEIGGKVATVGGRLLDAAARIVIRQFFEALSRRAGGKRRGFFARLLRRGA